MFNKITLYHYSNINITRKISVKYYGYNNYTSNDVRLTNVKRAFYYTKPEPETLLRGSQYLYTVKYPKARLYDITKDLRGYLIGHSISEALYRIKQRYNGIIYNIGKIEVVNLFYDTRYNNKINLINV